MSKKINNLSKNKANLRKACYCWIILMVVAMLGLSAYCIYFADWSAVSFTRDIGITPSMFMRIMGTGLISAVASALIVPAWAILELLRKSED